MSTNKNNFIIGILLVLFGAVFGVLGSTVVEVFTEKQQIEDENLKKIADLMDMIENSSYYYVGDDKLYEGAYRGILDSLGDPYSVYFSEKELKEFNEQINSSYAGLGIHMSNNGPYPIITKVLPNSPAEDGGLKEGQTILKVDGVDLRDKTIIEIGGLIKGDVDTIRKLTIVEDDFNSPIEINIGLGILNVPTVSYEIYDIDNERIGYLSITTFATLTYQEFLTAMGELEKSNIDSLIVDVRGNPGGLLSTVTQILDYLINTDKPFMFQENRHGNRTPYYLNMNDHVVNYDIVVLIDEHSASASEVFAAAMSEIENYPLIGVKSFGKGTAQIPYYFQGADGMKVTNTIWLTPNANWIHEVGINPTIEVQLTNFANLNFIDSTQNMSYDHVNQETVDIQYFFNELTNANLRTDGYFDLATKQAVEAYQTANNLSVTGVVDTQTAYQINIDIMEYIEDIEYDNQLQAAFYYLLN